MHEIEITSALYIPSDCLSVVAESVVPESPAEEASEPVDSLAEESDAEVSERFTYSLHGFAVEAVSEKTEINPDSQSGEEVHARPCSSNLEQVAQDDPAAGLESIELKGDETGTDSDTEEEYVEAQEPDGQEAFCVGMTSERQTFGDGTFDLLHQDPMILEEADLNGAENGHSLLSWDEFAENDWGGSSHPPPSVHSSGDILADSGCDCSFGPEHSIVDAVMMGMGNQTSSVFNSKFCCAVIDPPVVPSAEAA